MNYQLSEPLYDHQLSLFLSIDCKFSTLFTAHYFLASVALFNYFYHQFLGLLISIFLPQRAHNIFPLLSLCRILANDMTKDEIVFCFLACSLVFDI